MLAKCANPACNAPFRRLSEGKLFLVESECAEKETPLDPFRGKPPRHVEYFWLCAECAPLITLSFNAKTGVMTVPIPVDQQVSISASARKAVRAERAAGMLARAAALHHY